MDYFLPKSLCASSCKNSNHKKIAVFIALRKHAISSTQQITAPRGQNTGVPLSLLSSKPGHAYVDIYICLFVKKFTDVEQTLTF